MGLGGGPCGFGSGSKRGYRVSQAGRGELLLLKRVVLGGKVGSFWSGVGSLVIIVEREMW